MEKLIKKGILFVISMIFIAALSTCKSSDSSSSTISIDISGLKENLLISDQASQSNSIDGSDSQASSADVSSDSQDEVVSLMIAPLTFSNHGEKYSMDEFDEEAEADMENDAVNSVSYLQFVQLSSSSSTVEIEVPTISDGWQLIAVATNVEVNDVQDLNSDDNDGAMKYIGFTEEAFTSADDFSSSNTTLSLKRFCDQDEDYRPKGCATFDGEDPAEAIVTAAVEIHGITIDGVSQTPSVAFPWIVRSSPTSNQISATTAEDRLQAIYDGYGSTIESITVTATHQRSVSKSTLCQNLNHEDATSDFNTQCGFQTYSRNY